jgi:hypothetical protein
MPLTAMMGVRKGLVHRDSELWLGKGGEENDEYLLNCLVGPLKAVSSKI